MNRMSLPSAAICPFRARARRREAQRLLVPNYLPSADFPRIGDHRNPPIHDPHASDPMPSIDILGTTQRHASAAALSNSPLVSLLRSPWLCRRRKFGRQKRHKYVQYIRRERVHMPLMKGPHSYSGEATARLPRLSVGWDNATSQFDTAGEQFEEVACEFIDRSSAFRVYFLGQDAREQLPITLHNTN